MLYVTYIPTGPEDDNMMCPMHTAAVNHSSTIMSLLVRAGADPNQMDGGPGRTPMYYATRFSNIEMINLLGAWGGNPNSVHIAIKERWNDTVLRILEKLEVLIDSRDTKSYGRTPLHAAVSWGNAPMVHALIAKGAKAGLIFGHT